jgi:hypothetical protein
MEICIYQQKPGFPGENRKEKETASPVQTKNRLPLAKQPVMSG